MTTRSKRKRQTRLDFSPLPDSSPAKAAQPEAIRNRVAAVVFNGASPSASRQSTRFSPLPTPEASSAVTSSLNVDQAPASSSRSTRNKASFMSRSKSKRGGALSSSMRSSPPSEATKLRDSLRDRFPSESDSDGPVASSQRSRQHHQKQRKKRDLDDSDDELAFSDTQARLSKRRRRNRDSQDDNSDAEDGSELNMANADDDDDDDVIAVTPRRVKRTIRLDEESDVNQDSSEEEVASTSRRRRLKRPYKRHNPPSDDESGREEHPSDSDQLQDDDHAQRRSRDERADLQEDLEFLAPSDGESPEAEDTPRQSRPLSAKKSAKQQALEALKRRRQQSSAGLSSDMPIPLSDHEATMYDTIDEEPTAEDWTYQQEDSGEDFIVDEDNDEVVEIPTEFRLRTAKPKVLFRLVVDWCVQRKINPGFDSRAPEYDIAFTRLSDFVNGLGGSKYQSSAWTASFKRGLLARPLLQELHTPVSVLMHDRCDACNRSGHPASYEVKFQGHPYHKESLEDFSDDEDETGLETEIPDAERIFYIGKTCMRNARVSHQLHHWRYHLNSWIVDYLEENLHLTPEQVLKRDGQSTRRRGRAANKIVEQMEKKGDIKALYRDFKHEIDAAQSGEGAGSSSLDYDSD